MHNDPTPTHLLAAVSQWLRTEVLPVLTGHGEDAQAYQARVAAKLLDTVVRQLQQAPEAEQAERQRLQALLGEAAAGIAEPTDNLATLNRALAQALADGRLDAHTPGLAEHLWATTLATLAVDQPGYGHPPSER